MTRGEGSADAFDALVDAVDAVAARFGGERFYDQRIPHFSVAWSLRSLAPQIASPAGDRASRAVGGHAVRCERVEVRIGERVTEFRLRTCVAGRWTGGRGVGRVASAREPAHLSALHLCDYRPGHR